MGILYSFLQDGVKYANMEDFCWDSHNYLKMTCSIEPIRLFNLIEFVVQTVLSILWLLPMACFMVTPPVAESLIMLTH